MTIVYGYVGYDVRFEMSVFMNLRFGSNASQNALNIRPFKTELVTSEWIGVQVSFFVFF